MSALARIVEALLFLSPEPVALADLAAACEASPEEVGEAIGELEAALTERGIVLQRVAGGYALATDPVAEDAARRLLAKPRTPPLTPAQAETLAIVAYLQPVSRPEITRIRGVSADSATATLLERGLIEEAGRSQFGAVLYRTTGLFLTLFGLDAVSDLPEIAAWDPSPEEESALRERLLRAGEARAAGPQEVGLPSQRRTLESNSPVLGGSEPDDVQPLLRAPPPGPGRRAVLQRSLPLRRTPTRSTARRCAPSAGAPARSRRSGSCGRSTRTRTSRPQPPAARTPPRCRGPASGAPSRGARAPRARRGTRRSPRGPTPRTSSRSGCTG